MKFLINVLVWGWALLVLGSLVLTYTEASGWPRIWTFAGWQGAAFVLALIAAALAFSRKEPRGTQGWWMGYGPLVGSLFIAGFVALAVFTAQFL